MLNDGVFYYGDDNERIAHELIRGKSSEEIANGLVKKMFPEIDSVDECGECTMNAILSELCEFEQHLLGGSIFLNKKGRFFRKILKEYKSTAQGREYLREHYKEHIFDGLRKAKICFFFLWVV